MRCNIGHELIYRPSRVHNMGQRSRQSRYVQQTNTNTGATYASRCPFIAVRIKLSCHSYPEAMEGKTWGSPPERN